MTNILIPIGVMLIGSAVLIMLFMMDDLMGQVQDLQTKLKALETTLDWQFLEEDWLYIPPRYEPEIDLWEMNRTPLRLPDIQTN